MHVGLVCPYDLGHPGGVQQLTVELADQLRLRGDEVTLVAAGKRSLPGGPGRDVGIVPVGRPFIVRGNRSRVPVTLSPASWSRAREALSEVDVVHVHEPMVPLVGWVGLSIGGPTVATFHADAPQWVRTLYRWSPFIVGRMRRAVITAVSAAAADALPDSWGPVTVVPNAIDVASYRLEVGRVRRRIAFLGRDEPRKGLDVVLSAWPHIRQAVPDAELVVMGASRDEQIDGVSFRGAVTAGEKRRLLASSSIFVAPNTGGESFGIVVIEGMAAGCAVVASDLPAFRPVLGDAGVTFEVGDAHGLAQAVVALCADPDGMAEIAARGRSHVRQFDWSVVVGQYRAIYEKALS